MSEPEHQLETARLRLRPLSATDVDALVDLDSDPEVRRYVDLPVAPSRAEVHAALPRLLLRFGPTGEPAFRAAVEKESGRFCGWFHLRPLDRDPTTLDLGFRLRRECWGRGLATEGARALVDRAFRTIGADRIVAHALEANDASRRVLEKVGLSEERRYLHRDRLPAVAYSLLLLRPL